jgi:hypothetical protein
MTGKTTGGGQMKDKTKNTTAFSLFGSASATSANGADSNSESKAISTVNITVDIAGLISKGKELLEDESLDTSSGKFKFFQARGKEILKERPELAKEFEKITNWSGFLKMVDSGDTDAEMENKKRRHQYAFEAVKRGVEFLELLEG